MEEIKDFVVPEKRPQANLEKKKGFYASYFKICHVFGSGCCSHSSMDKDIWTDLQNTPSKCLLLTFVPGFIPCLLE